MRQVGILAAAGLMALEDGPKRLHKDHENARRLAEGLDGLPRISVDVDGIATNIVIFSTADTGRTPLDIIEGLKGRNILASTSGDSIRMVTHLDISRD